MTKPITPAEAKQNHDIANKETVRTVRERLNRDLIERPRGTYWDSEDYRKPVIDAICAEFTAAGWTVHRCPEGMIWFTAPGVALAEVKS